MKYPISKCRWLKLDYYPPRLEFLGEVLIFDLGWEAKVIRIDRRGVYPEETKGPLRSFVERENFN